MSNAIENIQLLLEDVISFHNELEKIFVVEKGIHDNNLLESAVHAPFQTFGGKDLYPDIYAKAVQLKNPSKSNVQKMQIANKKSRICTTRYGQLSNYCLQRQIITNTMLIIPPLQAV